mmetsp:Transcript_19694/g.31000  ORF Transcript_19694/g.31000 Transcript_19694/m.31000 type:complete len:256 (+) Transcript_19694:37-804(+)
MALLRALIMDYWDKIMPRYILGSSPHQICWIEALKLAATCRMWESKLRTFANKSEIADAIKLTLVSAQKLIEECSGNGWQATVVTCNEATDRTALLSLDFFPHGLERCRFRGYENLAAFLERISLKLNETRFLQAQVKACQEVLDTIAYYGLRFGFNSIRFSEWEDNQFYQYDLTISCHPNAGDCCPGRDDESKLAVGILRFNLVRYSGPASGTGTEGGLILDMPLSSSSRKMLSNPFDDWVPPGGDPRKHRENK